MSDKLTNGAEWQRLLERLLDFYDVLNEAAQTVAFAWQPRLLTTWSPEQARMAWRRAEVQHTDAIHASARELVRTNRLVDLTPEVLYFLELRLEAAMRHAESIFAMSMDQPVSLVPFPAIPAEAYAEWLLTEWGDDHASAIVFPDDVCVTSPLHLEPATSVL